MPVRRFATFFLLIVLVFAHSTSFAAAICHHESLAAHDAARQSHDAGISAVAFREDAADSVASKKGALADAGGIGWIADLSPGPGLAIPFASTPSLDPDLDLVRTLVGRSLAPLLEPPAA